MAAERTCSIDDCDRRHEARGWCRMHYVRWKTHGDPLKLGYPTGDASPNKQRVGQAHPRWVGDAASYTLAHQRVYAARGPASAHLCTECRGPATQWAYDNDDPNEKSGMNSGRICAYSTDVTHYDPMCTSCHKLADNAYRLEGVSSLGS